MGYEAPEKLQKGLERGYDFYPKVVTPLRGLPAFGDTWGTGNVSAMLRGALKLFDKPAYRWLATDGKQGAPPAFTSTRLPWAGFYVMRSGWDRRALYLCLDAGPLGTGHWHEDFNNFECYAYGERLICEVGVYSYTASKWRQYVYSSLAHNVVLVDGLGQNRACDARAHTRADRPREHDWHSDQVFDLAWGHYDGRWGHYADNHGWRNRFGRDKAVRLATHRRDICFVKSSYFVISDRLEAAGEHAYAQLFHLMPDRTAKVLGKGRAGTVDAGRANVVLVQADPVRAQVIAGRDEPLVASGCRFARGGQTATGRCGPLPPQGWFSRRGLQVEPAPVISFDQTARDRAIYDTVLLPLDAGQEPRITVERVPVADGQAAPVPPAAVCALRIVTPRGTDLYVNDLRQREIGPANGRVKTAGGLTTDARAAVVRLDTAGRVLACSAVGATFLKLDGKAIWQPQKQQEQRSTP